MTIDSKIFTDRVYEQMILFGYDAQKLAKEIGVSHTTVYDLLKCKYQQPSTIVFFRLLELFHCSADYLLGFLEFPTENVVYHTPLSTYGTRIRELLQKHDIKQKIFCQDMHISSALLYKWLTDKTLPSVEYLVKLAKYFDMSVDIFIKRIQ